MDSHVSNFEQDLICRLLYRLCIFCTLRRFSHEDPLRVSAFAAASLFVLLSDNETQPLSVMMAMAAGTPVLLLRVPYTFEPPFAGLPTVESRDVRKVCAAIEREWTQPRPTRLPDGFTWPAVVAKLSDIYSRALGAG